MYKKLSCSRTFEVVGYDELSGTYEQQETLHDNDVWYERVEQPPIKVYRMRNRNMNWHFAAELDQMVS